MGEAFVTLETDENIEILFFSLFDIFCHFYLFIFYIQVSIQFL